MKIQSLLIATILAIGASQTVKAQQALEASSQAVTVAFTGKEQIPAYNVDGELTDTLPINKEDKKGNIIQEGESYKMGSVAYKFGNKELLQEALGEDVSISGWSIVYKVSSDGVGALVATKKNEDDVNIDSIDISQYADSEAFTYTTSTITSYTYNKDDEQTSITQTYSDSGTIEGPIAITYGDVEMIGYSAGSYKAVTWYESVEDPDTGKLTLDKSAVSEPVIIPGAVKITGLAGSLESDYGTSVFTGSVNLAAAKANKVSQ
ncbi:MAG: hypothetical protein NTW41_08005 [Verrucomicrobia bacterium]|nr:hypothetical protein [Verrucomicrobiota bacterium]